MKEQRAYQFPPQLGQVHYYFGYSGKEILILVGIGISSMYGLMITMHVLVLLPFIMSSILLCRIGGNQSVWQILHRAYGYFIANPMIYEYMEDEI